MAYGKATPAVRVGLAILILLSAIFAFWLPPRQRADIVGILAAVTAHILTVAVLDRLFQRRYGLLLTVGVGVTALLYWCFSLGTAIMFRLFLVTAWDILLTAEIIYAVVAGIIIYGFYLGQRFDSGRKGDRNE